MSASAETSVRATEWESLLGVASGIIYEDHSAPPACEAYSTFV